MLAVAPWLAVSTTIGQCRTDLDCSLNGLCSSASGTCTCDRPWTGDRCQTLQLAPGLPGLYGKPLCAYHGGTANTTSWGGSVVHAPEDGKFYMWVAEMVNNCTMGEWETNSEVVLAVSPKSPLGPFEKVKTIIEPWAHNPQAIRAPDNTSESGFVYAVYTLGDGLSYHGQPKVCSSPPPGPPAPPRPPGPPGPPWKTGGACPHDAAHAMPLGGCMDVNFTIYYSDDGPAGEYKRHTAQILGWPVHSRGRPWEFGPYGNWNPAPLVHPNGSIYVLAHTEQYGFKHGEAIITADSWRGPYRLVSSDSDARWGGSTANAEDPFMWIDKRGNWHQLIEGNPMPGGHAWSRDGIVWSNMSGCNGLHALEGCFNLSRPYYVDPLTVGDEQSGSSSREAMWTRPRPSAPTARPSSWGVGTTSDEEEKEHGERGSVGPKVSHVSYYTERPKLLLDADGTPMVLYGTVYETVEKGVTRGFTIAEPLGPAE